MNELKIVNHLIKLFDIAQKNGILQLEENYEKLFIKNDLYKFCLRKVLDNNFKESYKYLKYNRNRKEIIIIEGFKFISFLEKNKNFPINKIINKLSSLMKNPKDYNSNLYYPTKEDNIFST